MLRPFSLSLFSFVLLISPLPVNTAGHLANISMNTYDLLHTKATQYTVEHFFRASQLHNFGMQKFRCMLILHFPNVLLERDIRPLRGKLNFCRHLILWFYSTHKNLLPAIDVYFTVTHTLSNWSWPQNSKTGAIRCQILSLKCTKLDFRWRSTPDPLWELTPRPPSCILGA